MTEVSELRWNWPGFREFLETMLDCYDLPDERKQKILSRLDDLQRKEAA